MDQRRPGGDHDAFAEHTDDVLFDTDVFLTELSKGGGGPACAASPFLQR